MSSYVLIAHVNVTYSFRAIGQTSLSFASRTYRQNSIDRYILLCMLDQLIKRSSEKKELIRTPGRHMIRQPLRDQTGKQSKSRDVKQDIYGA